MNSGLLAAGIFREEPGQRLLQVLLSLSERGFRGLYDSAGGKCNTAYYQEGLRRVFAWPDEVVQEDVDYVCQKFPDYEHTFENCYALYTKEWQKAQRRESGPGVLRFTRMFYECLSQQDPIMNGEFFTGRNVLVKKVSCMDAARQAIYTIMSSDEGRYMRAGGGDDGSEVSSVHRQQKKRTPHAPPYHMAKGEGGQRDAPPPLDAYNDMVGPNDSISNVNVPSRKQDAEVYLENDLAALAHPDKSEEHAYRRREEQEEEATPKRQPTRVPEAAPPFQSRRNEAAPEGEASPSSPPRRDAREEAPVRGEEGDRSYSTVSLGVTQSEVPSGNSVRSRHDPYNYSAKASMGGNTTSIGMRRAKSPGL